MTGAFTARWFTATEALWHQPGTRSRNANFARAAGTTSSATLPSHGYSVFTLSVTGVRRPRLGGALDVKVDVERIGAAGVGVAAQRGEGARDIRRTAGAAKPRRAVMRAGALQGVHVKELRAVLGHAREHAVVEPRVRPHRRSGRPRRAARGGAPIARARWWRRFLVGAQVRQVVVHGESFVVALGPMPPVMYWLRSVVFRHTRSSIPSRRASPVCEATSVTPDIR